VQTTKSNKKTKRLGTKALPNHIATRIESRNEYKSNEE